jgi:hypothetical protein
MVDAGSIVRVFMRCLNSSRGDCPLTLRGSCRVNGRALASLMLLNRLRMAQPHTASVLGAMRPRPPGFCAPLVVRLRRRMTPAARWPDLLVRMLSQSTEPKIVFDHRVRPDRNLAWIC